MATVFYREIEDFRLPAYSARDEERSPRKTLTPTHNQHKERDSVWQILGGWWQGGWTAPEFELEKVTLRVTEISGGLRPCWASVNFCDGPRKKNLSADCVKLRKTCPPGGVWQLSHDTKLFLLGLRSTNLWGKKKKKGAGKSCKFMTRNQLVHIPQILQKITVETSTKNVWNALQFAAKCGWRDDNWFVWNAPRVHKNKSVQRLISSLWGPGTAKFQVTWLLRIVQNGVSVL